VPVLVHFLDSKLQSDLKTTKFEETKIALEVCYKEIQRLHSEKLTPSKTTPRYWMPSILDLLWLHATVWSALSTSCVHGITLNK